MPLLSGYPTIHHLNLINFLLYEVFENVLMCRFSQSACSQPDGSTCDFLIMLDHSGRL